VGTLCVIGSHARSFSDAERGIAESLAARVLARIESRERKANGDGPAA
jgi:GAF domain-containing protein